MEIHHLKVWLEKMPANVKKGWNPVIILSATDVGKTLKTENLVLKNEFWYSTTPIIGIKYTRLSVMVKQPM